MKNFLMAIIFLAVSTSCVAFDYSTSNKKMLNEISELRAELKKLECTKKEFCIIENFKAYLENQTMVICKNNHHHDSLCNRENKLYIYIADQSAYTIQLITADQVMYYSFHAQKKDEAEKNRTIEAFVTNVYSVAFTGK